MTNTNYNAYLLIVISESNQLLALHPDYSTSPISDENFSHKITISEDGTLWAMSLEPDPDGGGAKMYYSTIPNQWHEITTSHPGAIAIAGGKGSSCFYIDGTEGAIYLIQKDGTPVKHFSERRVYEIAAGGGKLWAVYGPNHDGDIPKLHRGSWDPPFNFNEFKTDGNVTPTSISADHRGDCYAVIYENPWFYRGVGTNSGAVADNIQNIALQISCKRTNFILTIDSNKNGNQIMQFGAPGYQVYDYGNIDLRGIKVLATYNTKES